ncbi:MAG: manganese efflux pump MntP family protein [Desulfobulbaceae bacterium]|nr:manganese efflux pump MntP family protein [Desulfobulbaceae bacterium]MDY0351857.1 manganese efflux pump MntP family protein [Desulfobulbaceae bacterium]
MFDQHTLQIFQIFLIAVGLAADSFAVSVSSGAIIEKLRLRHAMRIALFFGFFQGLMPWIGWQVGTVASTFIRSFDHWLAFGILCFIGGKMVYESRILKEDIEEAANPFSLYVLFGLAIATSIDALAVGITFPFLNIAIIEPVLIIGIVTFVFSFAGTYIGEYFGHIFEDKIELAGGLILVGIGCKILIEHTLLQG